jgi:predicted ester cyclase
LQAAGLTPTKQPRLRGHSGTLAQWRVPPPESPYACVRFSIRSMSAESNEALVRRLYDAVWSSDDFQVADELIAEDELHHPHGRTVAGGPAFQKQAARAFRAAFPDARFALEVIVSTADPVAVRWRCTATHAETGTNINDYVGVNFSRIADGQIVKIWDTRDDLSLFAQLGLAPPAADLMSQVYGSLD